MKYKKLYSFDIFDTCLARICGEPKNIFDIMAVRILGEGITPSQLNDFRYARVKAEQTARSKVHGRDITLNEIYNNSDFTFLTQLPKEKIMEVEMEVEADNLCAIYSTLCKIRDLHKENKYVVYISDMYLPSSFIVNILKREGFWVEGDKLFLSCECSSTKSRGKLYDEVKRSEKPSILSWIHSGDNRWSDFIMPLCKGIRAKRVNFDYTFYEKTVRSLDFNPENRVPSMVSGISRSIIINTKEDPHVSFCADIIAPIYVPFVYRVMADAQRKGIKKLYFLARDGYIFYNISKVFDNLFPDVDVHYLYASRKSLYFPSIENIDEKSIESIIIKDHSLDESIDNLQITFTQEERRILSESKNIVQTLLSTSSIRNKLQLHWEQQKELCLSYFKQEGLASHNADSAIVDLRGSRHSQISINNILRKASYKPVYSYYLEVTHNRILNSDKYDAVFFGDNITNNVLYKGLKDSKYLLEHYFSITPFKRTSFYKREGDKIVAVFDEKEIVNKESVIITNTNIKVCTQFAERFVQLHMGIHAETVLNLGLNTLSSFMINPNRYYLKALLNVNVSQTQYKNRKLIKYVGPVDILRKRVMWYEGSIKLTYGGLGLWLYNEIVKKCVRMFFKI